MHSRAFTLFATASSPISLSRATAPKQTKQIEVDLSLSDAPAGAPLGRRRLLAPSPAIRQIHAGSRSHPQRERAGGGAVLAGFDFPIGLPLAFARRVGVAAFTDVLPELGSGRWERFYDLAERADEIGLTRPFYPRRPGGTLHAQLVAALGVGAFSDLLRRCERRTATRNDACSLFWTLGGNQVGRAAIAGWRAILAPALRDRPGQVGLWPFQGDLEAVLGRFPVVVAETYPAEACVHLGLTPPGRGWSKRNAGDRQRAGLRVAGRCAGELQILPALQQQIESGFGGDASGEDPFDAFVGLVSMLEVVAGRRPAAPALDDEVRRVEGWILGQGV